MFLTVVLALYRSCLCTVPGQISSNLHMGLTYVETGKTYIWPYHRDLEDWREGKHLSYWNAIVRPVTDIVSEPMAHIRSSAQECASSNDKRSVLRPAREHSISRVVWHHCAVQVVRVVLNQTVIVNEIGIDCLVWKTARCILDTVWWVNQITTRQAHHTTGVLLATDHKCRCRGRRLEVRWKAWQSNRWRVSDWRWLGWESFLLGISYRVRALSIVRTDLPTICIRSISLGSCRS